MGNSEILLDSFRAIKRLHNFSPSVFLLKYFPFLLSLALWSDECAFDSVVVRCSGDALECMVVPWCGLREVAAGSS